MDDAEFDDELLKRHPAFSHGSAEELIDRIHRELDKEEETASRAAELAEVARWICIDSCCPLTLTAATELYCRAKLRQRLREDSDECLQWYARMTRFIRMMDRLEGKSSEDSEPQTNQNGGGSMLN